MHLTSISNFFSRPHHIINQKGIADTGATTNMVTQNTQVKNIRQGPKVSIIMPDNSTTTSHQQANLLVNLPPQATKAHIVPSFKKVLVSIPQVVDAGYKAIFDKSDVKIISQTTNKVEW